MRVFTSAPTPEGSWCLWTMLSWAALFTGVGFAYIIASAFEVSPAM
jgi:hypothetical protein